MSVASRCSKTSCKTRSSHLVSTSSGSLTKIAGGGPREGMLRHEQVARAATS